MFKNRFIKKLAAVVLTAVMLAGCGANTAPADDDGKHNSPAVTDQAQSTDNASTAKDDDNLARPGSDSPIRPLSFSGDINPLTEDAAAETYDALNRFSFDYYNKVAEENGTDSTVMSSLSAHFALGMLLQGTKGDTAAELAAALGVTKNQAAAAAKIISKEFDEISKTTPTTLNTANGVFMADRLDTSSCEDTYRALEYYQAEAFTGELSNDAAREFINSWISDNTDGMIPSVLDKNLDESAILVLINTICLDAEWQVPFINYGYDYEIDFTKPDGSTARLPALSDERQIAHIDSPDAEGLILDYSDGRLKFAAIMPKDPADDDFINNLSYERFSEYISSAKTERCYMEMPKMTIESSLDLNDILKKLGMNLIFDEDKADLTGFGVSPYGNIFVSKVFQKAKLEVDEEGTKAAAATVIVANDTLALIDPPPRVILDRSFFYCVYDSETQTPLFMGRYSG